MALLQCSLYCKSTENSHDPGIFVRRLRHPINFIASFTSNPPCVHPANNNGICPPPLRAMKHFVHPSRQDIQPNGTYGSSSSSPHCRHYIGCSSGRKPGKLGFLRSLTVVGKKQQGKTIYTLADVVGYTLEVLQFTPKKRFFLAPKDNDRIPTIYFQVPC